MPSLCLYSFDYGSCFLALSDSRYRPRNGERPRQVSGRWLWLDVVHLFASWIRGVRGHDRRTGRSVQPRLARIRGSLSHLAGRTTLGQRFDDGLHCSNGRRTARLFPVNPPAGLSKSAISIARPPLIMNSEANSPSLQYFWRLNNAILSGNVVRS